MRFGLIVGQIEKIGGMEKQAILLARELIERGSETTLFIAGPKKKTATTALGGLPHKYLYRSRYTNFLSSILLRHYCRAGDITHIIAFNAENAELAATSKVKGGTALNVRGIRFTENIGLAERYRSVAGRCDKVVTNSVNTAILLAGIGIADREDIEVIHNGVLLPATHTQPDGKTVLWVGSMKEVKDPMCFVEACRRTIEDSRQVKIVMAGEGAMRADIERFINVNGLKDNFTLLGEIPSEEIPYASAAIFVNSSIRESSSNSVLEALSFGIPVVATDNPGNRDVLSGLDHHRIVPVSDPAEMAQAIRELLDIDRDSRNLIAGESRKYIEDQYSIAKMVDGYIRMFTGN